MIINGEFGGAVEKVEDAALTWRDFGDHSLPDGGSIAALHAWWYLVTGTMMTSSSMRR